MKKQTTSILSLASALLVALVPLIACSATVDAPATPAGTPADTTVDETSRGSGSIGGWRAQPGQRTIFNRGFRIPTTLSFRADRGNWSGNISVVDTASNRSLCQRTIFGGGQTSCSGIQGNFRISVANDANSRDTATGEIRFNN